MVDQLIGYNIVDCKESSVAVSQDRLPLFTSPTRKNYQDLRNRLRNCLRKKENGSAFNEYTLTSFSSATVPPLLLENVGRDRLFFLGGIKGWGLPLNTAGLDITNQDTHTNTAHHVLLDQQQQPLASVRTITAAGFGGDIDRYPFLCFQELKTGVGENTTVNQAFREYCDREGNEALADAIHAGKIATIERLVPGQNAFSNVNDQKDALAVSLGTIGPVAVHAARHLYHENGIRYVVLQTDSSSLRMFNEVLGLTEEDLIHTQYNKLQNGDPDACHTVLLDIEKAIQFTAGNNAPVHDFFQGIYN